MIEVGVIGVRAGVGQAMGVDIERESSLPGMSNRSSQIGAANPGAMKGQDRREGAGLGVLRTGEITGNWSATGAVGLDVKGRDFGLIGRNGGEAEIGRALGNGRLLGGPEVVEFIRRRKCAPDLLRSNRRGGLRREKRLACVGERNATVKKAGSGQFPGDACLASGIGADGAGLELAPSVIKQFPGNRSRSGHVFGISGTEGDDKGNGFVFCVNGIRPLNGHREDGAWRCGVEEGR